jgi:hypothetical protein
MSPVEHCCSPLPLSRADLGELIAALDISFVDEAVWRKTRSPMATKREGKAPPLISICPSNRDHAYSDMAAKHRTQNPKKGGDGHSFPPFGELPELFRPTKLRLDPFGSRHE